MRILLGVLLSLSLVGPALANPAAGFQQTSPPPPQAGGQTGGGFVGPSTPVGVATVLQALKARDDAPCVLEGYIVQRVTGEESEYIFSDSTGQILVEISQRFFGGLTVTPNNLVRITGKVNGNVFRRNKINVVSLQVRN